MHMSIDAFADFRMVGHDVIITGAAQNTGAGLLCVQTIEPAPCFHARCRARSGQPTH